MDAITHSTIGNVNISLLTRNQESFNLQIILVSFSDATNHLPKHQNRLPSDEAKLAAFYLKRMRSNPLNIPSMNKPRWFKRK